MDDIESLILKNLYELSNQVKNEFGDNHIIKSTSIDVTKAKYVYYDFLVSLNENYKTIMHLNLNIKYIELEKNISFKVVHSEQYNEITKDCFVKEYLSKELFVDMHIDILNKKLNTIFEKIFLCLKTGILDTVKQL